MRTKICSYCFTHGHTRKFCPHLPVAEGPKKEVARLQAVNQTLRDLAKMYLAICAEVDRGNGIDPTKDVADMKAYIDSLR